jgi:hypothetical protein
VICSNARQATKHSPVTISRLEPTNRNSCANCAGSLSRSEAVLGAKRKGPGETGALRRVFRLDVRVQHEFPRVWAEGDRVDLSLALVVDPGLDDVGREHAAIGQEGVVLLQRV